MSNDTQVLDYLKAELAERSRRNPNYSVRAFARSMGIHSSTLSALLSGRRPLTVRTAQRLLDQVGVEPHARRKLLDHLLQAGEGRPSTAHKYRVLGQDEFELVAGWEHFAILSLLEVRDARGTVYWIARRLGIPTGVTIDALGRLERAGLVRQAPGARSRRWELARQESRTTTHDVPAAAIRRAHRQYIERALAALERHGVDDRDITGVTFVSSRKRVREAKAMIRDFRRELCRFLESGDKEEVFRLNIQLFSLEK